MYRSRRVLGPLFAAVAVSLAFLPSLIRAEITPVPVGSPIDSVAVIGDEPLSPAPRQDGAAGSDGDVPDWVWGVIGGSAGAAVAAAAAYRVWLRRR